MPAQSPAVVLVKKVPDGAVSVTLNGPGSNVTTIPADEPAKLAGVRLLPVICIVKLDGIALVLPDTIFMTVNVAVVVGVGVVIRVVTLPGIAVVGGSLLNVVTLVIRSGY